MATQIGAQEVFGRDALISRLWKNLKSRSLRFTAERRVGKTTVMQKMANEPINGITVSYLDLEGVDSANRFVEVLINELRPLFKKRQNAIARFDQLLKKINGSEIAGMFTIQSTSNWQANLEETLTWVCEEYDNTLLVLMLDEIPYMLQKIASTNSTGRLEALSLIDTLRIPRPKLRMVYAGSVGLHHVLNTLKNDELASEPFNHMPQIEILPLTIDDATSLAKSQIKHEGINICSDRLNPIAHEIAIQSDCVPFYMERVTARLSEKESAISKEDVTHIVQTYLTDDSDPWEMEHFRSRLKIYYPDIVKNAQERPVENHKIASTILDILALADKPLSINAVWSALKAQMAFSDRNKVIELLRLLTKDHYLRCNTNKRYAFRFDLIKQWWLKAQGLEGQPSND